MSEFNASGNLVNRNATGSHPGECLPFGEDATNRGPDIDAGEPVVKLCCGQSAEGIPLYLKLQNAEDYADSASICLDAN